GAAHLPEAHPVAGPLDFEGWPRRSVAAQRALGKGGARIVVDTFLPPEWWLRLRHAGVREASQRRARHAAEIVGLAARFGVERAGRWSGATRESAVAIEPRSLGHGLLEGIPS